MLAALNSFQEVVVMILSQANKVNVLLETQGSRVVQEKKVGNRPAVYGYKPQFVIDAVNEVIGAENWHYQLHDTELFPSGEDGQSGQVVVAVEIFIRASAESEFASHGIQFGQSQVVYGNVGDAK